MIALLASSACGGVSATPDANEGDDDVAIDAQPIDGPPAAACDLSQPFGAPEQLANVNTDSNETEASVSADGLTLYFGSNRVGGVGLTDMYSASRPSLSDDFGTPIAIPDLNTVDHDTAPIVSDDGLTLFFGRRAAAGTWDIFIATRGSTAASFGSADVLLNVNDVPTHDLATDINGSMTTLYLSSTRSGDWETYRATRAGSTGPFNTPTPIGELNVAAVEDYGSVLTDDELTVYFESARVGGLGCYDVYVATRSTTGDGFGAPTAVAELSTDVCEYPTWVSGDGCQIIVTSNRPGTLGGYDLWIAKRPP